MLFGAPLQKGLVVVLDDCDEFFAELLADPVERLELLKADDGKRILLDAGYCGVVDKSFAFETNAFMLYFLLGEMHNQELVAKVDGFELASFTAPHSNYTNTIKSLISKERFRVFPNSNF